MKHDDGIEVILKLKDGDIIPEFDCHHVDLGVKSEAHRAQIKIKPGMPFEVIVRIAPHFRIYTASGLGVAISYGHEAEQPNSIQHEQTTWIGKHAFGTADTFSIGSFHLWRHADRTNREDKTPVVLEQVEFTIAFPSDECSHTRPLSDAAGHISLMEKQKSRENLSSYEHPALLGHVLVTIIRGHVVGDPFGNLFALKHEHRALNERALTEPPFHRSLDLDSQTCFATVAKDWASPLGGKNGHPYIFRFENTVNASKGAALLEGDASNSTTSITVDQAWNLQGSVRYRDDEEEDAEDPAIDSDDDSDSDDENTDDKYRDGDYDPDEEDETSSQQESDDEARESESINHGALPDAHVLDRNRAGEYGAGIVETRRRGLRVRRSRSASNASEHTSEQSEYNNASKRRRLRRRHQDRADHEVRPGRAEWSHADESSEADIWQAPFAFRGERGIRAHPPETGIRPTTATHNDSGVSADMLPPPPIYTEHDESMATSEQHSHPREPATQPVRSGNTAAVDDEEDEEDIRDQLEEVQLRRKLRAIEKRKKTRTRA